MANLYISSDNLVTLSDLTDAETDAYVNDATVVMSLFHKATKTPNTAAAVDKGGGLVGIPITAHGLLAGDYVRIEGSQNYNDEYAIVSATADEIVITATYVAETFLGTEVIYVGVKNGTNLSLSYVAASNGIYQGVLPDTLQRIVEYSASQTYGGKTETGYFYLFVEAVKSTTRLTKRISLKAIYDS